MKFNAGFSLIECLIALSLCAILTSLALPSYHRYFKNAYFSELIQAAAPYQIAVQECFDEQNSLNACKNGYGDIAQYKEPFNQNIKSIKVIQGKILITPITKHGLSAKDTYRLIPQINDEQLEWQSFKQHEG